MQKFPLAFCIAVGELVLISCSQVAVTKSFRQIRCGNRQWSVVAVTAAAALRYLLLIAFYDKQELL